MLGVNNSQAFFYENIAHFYRAKSIGEPVILSEQEMQLERLLNI